MFYFLIAIIIILAMDKYYAKRRREKLDNLPKHWWDSYDPPS